MATPTVGTQQNFFVEVFPIGQQVTTFETVPFTLMSSSAHVNAWIQTAVAPTYAARSAQIASDLETAYVSDTKWFGPALYTQSAVALNQNFGLCDATGKADGTVGPAFIQPPSHIDVLLVDPSQLGGGVGGDFSPLDLSTQGSANCFLAKSNEAMVVTIGISTTFTNLDYYLQQTAAHEFTHLIQFVNQTVILGRFGAAPPPINEGLAELARDLVLGHPDFGNVSQNSGRFFLPAPQNYSVLSMKGLENGTISGFTFGNYGAAYLLTRYIADRYGPQFAATYIQNDHLTSEADSYAALASAAGASSFNQLFGDFGATLAASRAGLPQNGPFAITSFALNGTFVGPTAFAASATFTLPGVGVAAILPAASGAPIMPGGIDILGTSRTVGGASFSANDSTGTLGLQGSIAF